MHRRSEIQQYIDEHDTDNGLVVIFTNDYKDPAVNYRTKRPLQALEECHEDGNEMETTFSETFGFACLRWKNHTAAQITRIMEQMGNCEYPQSYKCLAVVFSGHGEEDYVLGRDGNPVSIESDMIGPLQPSELPTMRTVPKLFFIDACRGNLKMVPATKAKGDGVEMGGYFIAYSTTKGYKSYTHGERSKWMPLVAQRLTLSSDKCVQEIIAEIAEEMRNDPHDMQCPDYTGSCQPVYLHQLQYEDTDGASPLAPDADSMWLRSKPKSSDSTIPNDVLGDSSLVDFVSATRDINDWRSLGLNVGLRKRTLEKIALDCNDKIDRCKMEMLQAWFNWVDDVEKKGKPSWLRLVDAVRLVDKPVADAIVKSAPWNEP